MNTVDYATNIMPPLDIDEVIARNLRRLRRERNLTQEELGRMINAQPQLINMIENNRKGMGKDIMTRLCRELDIHVYELYLDETAPVVEDDQMARVLGMMREARELGIIDPMIEYAEYLIQKAEKKQQKEVFKKKAS